jgi:peptidoglycan/xylan/chitin deacetylase (PgdA/CDA1 family)
MRDAVALGDIALTFDDGPDPDWTGPLLATLERHRARATFFVQGPAAEENPELISRAVAEGRRPHPEAGLAALERLGVRPTSWRPPWGDATEASVETALELGLELWGWSADTHDWRGDTCEQMLTALRASGLRGGEVILMHDGLGPGARRSGAEETVRLADRLLGASAAAGLRPVAVSDALVASRR